MNELLLILSLPLVFSGVLLTYRLFEKEGLYLWTILATITANIEVLILITAFGADMTLGNVLFASTFLTTDILSELYGKKQAQKGVYLGIAASVSFVILSQFWLLYRPAGDDWAMPAMKEIFSNTPRIMIVGVIVYTIVQLFDVWAYHKWWDYTTKKFGDAYRYLWLRNTGSTLVSQLLNTILFTLGAFLGVFDFSTLITIIIASYVIFIVTTLADIPFIYLARKIKERKQKWVI